MQFHDKHFPNESSAYRKARNELLSIEIEYRALVQSMAEVRQSLPLGGALKEDYLFGEKNGQGDTIKTKLSNLFANNKKSLVLYSFMYSEDMSAPCPACVSVIDSLNASVPHITDRINLAVIAKLPIEKLNTFARARNWQHIRLLSSCSNSYNQDYFAEEANGSQSPALNVFTKTTDGVFHTYSTELLYAKVDGHPRHVDSIWPLWNVFDMTPEGRGTDWLPKLEY